VIIPASVITQRANVFIPPLPCCLLVLRIVEQWSSSSGVIGGTLIRINLLVHLLQYYCRLLCLLRVVMNGSLKLLVLSQCIIQPI